MLARRCVVTPARPRSPALRDHAALVATALSVPTSVDRGTRTCGRGHVGAHWII